MAWESRRNGNRYYYTKKRVGKRVISEYHGKGEFVELVEGFVLESKLEREKERRFRRELQDLDSSVSHFVATVRQLIKEQLEADGYKYHKGQWR